MDSGDSVIEGKWGCKRETCTKRRRAQLTHSGENGRLRDALGRPLGALRISVTDRCNLRCQYCMPEEEYVWLPREDLLTFEEIGSLAEVFIGLGVEKIRLTGGEPLLRRDLPILVRWLAGIPGLADLAMTTNGVLLAEHAQALRDAGLRRVTVSLDTLRPQRFQEMVRRDSLRDVLAGIEAARAAGFEELKIDSVILRGRNDDEIPDLLEFGMGKGVEVRFLEYMDVGGATRWNRKEVVTRNEILEIIANRFGRPDVFAERMTATAERFALADGTVFGIIASTSKPFCRSCNRSRLTADGVWYLCLYAVEGTNLRQRLRGGASRDELKMLIRDIWKQRADRGAEERAAAKQRDVFVPVESLRRDPHLEMHTRGG